MPYHVPRSRLLPPRAAKEVERKRLLGVVQQAFGKSPVLVLAAGAGYGKSTLMSGMANAWVTLAEDCRDPVVLGWHLVESYRPRLGERLSEAERALVRGSWALASEALLDNLSGLQPHTLALDEAQRASSREALSLLRALSQAPGLRLAVLSRRAAPWEVLGRVIGEGELAFDAEEALELARAIAPELPAFEVERAHSLVKGWPLGLRLLLRAMQRGALPEEAFYAHPDPEGLLGYLVPALPKEVQKLAAKASVLGELGLEEAQWIVGSAGQGAENCSLATLEAHASDLLLERVGQRIRFHPLVRQALMGLLEPSEVRGLLTRAADKALEYGEGVRAAGYLLEAGRLGHAADLLLEQGENWLSQGLTYTVLSLLERLPEPMQQARPGVLYLQAEALRQAGRYSEAHRAYLKAKEAGVERAVLGLSRLFLDTVEPAKAWIYLEEAHVRFPEARLLWAENLLNTGRVEEASQMGLEGPRVWLRSGEPERALEALRQLGQPAAGLRPPLNHREGTLLLALLEAVAGDGEAAEAAARKGLREGETLGSPFVVALAESRLGHAYLARNRWEEARAAYQRALELAEGGPARLRQEALGGLAALGDPQSYTEMVRVSREAGDAWVEAFMTLVVALAYLRRGQGFMLPALGVADPFLQALAASYPAGNSGLLQRYPFLQNATLFAWPIERTRRLLWEAGKLDVHYHPGVRVEIEALGGLRLKVDGQEVKLKREKARLMLALLLVRSWSKESLMEALEVLDGEFRVLWSELLNTLEPGRPGRAPGYFLKPYGFVRVAELSVDLWREQSSLLPLVGLEHPEIEAFQASYKEALKTRLLGANEPQSWLKALKLEPTDESLLARLLETPLAKEAWDTYRAAMQELDLPLATGLKAPR